MRKQAQQYIIYQLQFLCFTRIKLWFRLAFMARCTQHKLTWKVCQWFVAGWWFSLGTLMCYLHQLNWPSRYKKQKYCWNDLYHLLLSLGHRRLRQTGFGSWSPTLTTGFGSWSPTLTTGFGSWSPTLTTGFGSWSPTLTTGFGSW